MPMRMCIPQDMESIAQMCAKAFQHDALFGEMMHPKRYEYPNDFVDYFRQRFVDQFGEPDVYQIVTLDRNEGERITGYAFWVRQRSRSDVFTVARDGPMTADVQAVPPVHFPVTTPNRAASPESRNLLPTAMAFLSHYWTGARAETWLLDFLAVDPDEQRKGYGREMVMYGVELAAREDVSASLIASEVGDSLYVACGFTAVGYMGEGEGNPLAGLPGGRIFFLDPPGSSWTLNGVVRNSA